MLKQFLPQLQTTFLKALQDSNRSVRLRAGTALAQLVTIHTRADPLFADVHNGIKSCEEQGVRETCVQVCTLYGWTDFDLTYTGRRCYKEKLRLFYFQKSESEFLLMLAKTSYITVTSTSHYKTETNVTKIEII